MKIKVTNMMESNILKWQNMVEKENLEWTIIDVNNLMPSQAEPS